MHEHEHAKRMENATVQENARPGTLDWQMTRFSFDQPDTMQDSSRNSSFTTIRSQGLPSAPSRESVRFWMSMNSWVRVHSARDMAIGR